jgi:hypothetical protein
MEVGIELPKGMDNLKQDLKDNIFQELEVNLQRGLGNFKREINDDLQQTLVVMRQHQEENLNDLLNLIKGQGHQQDTQPQPSDSSTSNTSPPLPPPPPYNSNSQPISQHQPLIIYPPKAKIELSKYNGGDNQCVAWFNKTKEYFHINNIKGKYASMYLEGTTYNWYLWWKGRVRSYNWNSFKNDFFKRFQGISEKYFFQNSPDYNKKEA